MGDKTGIAWTDRTFNPWMGCHKVSAGCKHCYAETLVTRRDWGPIWGANADRRRTSKPLWRKPLRWNREALETGERLRVFSASLADVFEDHPGPNAWRDDVFSLIRQTPYLDWQLLTKRPENLQRMLPSDWSVEAYPNVWLGTSIEDERVIDRAAHLISVPSVVHFVSYEPALGDLASLPLDDLEWVIFGGESGPGYRPMNMQWARDMRARCAQAGVAFFFKQSAAPRTEMGIHLDGEIVRAWPRDRSLAHAA